MEGLEITVIQFSDFLVDNGFIRLDSEYQSKERKQIISLLRSIGSIKFGDSNPEIIHPHEIARSYVEDGGVWFFRAQNVRAMLVDRSNQVFLSNADADYLSRNDLQINDVVLTRTGANAGDCALFTEQVRAIASSHTFIIRSQIWPHSYLTAFLNSIFGRSQILTSRYGAAQPEVAPYYIRNIWIPSLSKGFYDGIECCFNVARKKKSLAMFQLLSAEKTLLGILGLVDWQAPEPLSYVRRSSEAFLAGRLDAEHFHPKFSCLEQLLRDTGQSRLLEELLQVSQRGKQPEYSEFGLPVVNSRHVMNGEVRLDSENRQAKPSTDMLLIQPDDILMNGTGVGTIGRAAPYLHPGKAIPDNHVTVLRPLMNVIDPIYLAVFLNSLAGRMQVEQRLRGSSGQIELYPNDITQFTVWVAPDEIQAEIRQAILTGFEAKRKSAQLLDAAKRAVEIAIEYSESDALAYLDQTLAEAGEVNP